MDNSEISIEYQKALAEHNHAVANFRIAQTLYRSRQIEDTDFLSAKSLADKFAKSCDGKTIVKECVGSGKYIKLDPILVAI